MAKKKDMITSIELCQGVELSSTFFEKKENRLLTLLLKGIIVYLLTMGSIGFYLSALDAEYNEVLCHLIIGVTAILCAFLYYRLLVENTGYLLLFTAFGLLVYYFRTYINSGFYALVNMTVDEASQYLNVDIQRLYNEQIENRYVTITFVVLFIGIVLNVLLNVYISRRMQYVNSLFTIMSLNLIPLYLTEEPDGFYVVMMLAGLAMAYTLKSSGHYSPQVNIKRDDYVYKEKGRKNKKNKTISYVYDIKALTQAGISAAALALCVVLVVSAFKPKDAFNVGYGGNKYKDLTMAAMTTFLIDGWRGFYRDTEDVGGLQGGRLGNVSSVRLDYQTDLYVDMTPYSYDRIYLKSFTGIEYVPYANRWTSIEDLEVYDFEQTPEADVLKEYYDAGFNGAAKANMLIWPQDAVGWPYPYYTETFEVGEEENGAVFLIEYYPRTDINEAEVFLGDYVDGIAFTELDLLVPEENKAAVQSIISDIEWESSTEEKVSQLLEYFQENYPYTIRPGQLPRNEDFVNYFLTENKKGYCSYFASSAVLIFRELGIPARYVEGYAIDYNQIADGELMADADYDDYYDGYSEIGKTALVRINVTDADAHAWVELYITGKGWVPFDVTPAGEMEDVENFWEMFDELTEEQGEGAGTGANLAVVNFKIPRGLIKNICLGFLGIIGAVLFIFLGAKGIKYFRTFIKYVRAGINDKLIIKYSIFCKKTAKGNKKFKDMLNYREQIDFLFGEIMSWDEREKIISVLEKAGFSNTDISTEEYEYVINQINSKKPETT